MSTRTRDRGRAEAVEPEVVLGLTAFVVVVGMLALAWVSLQLAGGGAPPANNPIRLGVDVAQHKTRWTTATTVVAVLLVLVLAVFALSVRLAWSALRGTPNPADRKAQYMASPRDTRELTRRGAAKKANRLGVPKVEGAPPGVPCGRQKPGGATLLASWEDMSVVVAGPRTFKSTAYAIPQVLAAPGPVLATSNKRDIVDTTRGIREDFGRVWVLDPQNIAGEGPSWWWNPLTYIAPIDPARGRAERDPATGYVRADVSRARKLAEQFDASTRSSNAGQEDAHYGTAGTDLLTLMLLAAAVGDEPITTVYSWLTEPEEERPISLLAEHGLTLQSEGLSAYAHTTPKQRDGYYKTALVRVQFLRDPQMSRWIVPPASVAARLSQFHPHLYAGTRDTIYALSRNEAGGAGPIVAALTMAVFDALEAKATSSPKGRLSPPFLGVLDEAANICRIRDLDSYYSFFGSLGIVLTTILQSWAQGEEAWGKLGMEKLWGAANMRLYGGGVADPTFLRRVSDLIGTYDRLTSSRSTGRGGATRNTQSHQQPVFDVAELGSLRDRAIALPSQTPAVLVGPEPWFRGSQRKVIQASLERFSPYGADQPGIDSWQPGPEDLASVHRTAGQDGAHQWAR